jgi:8-oxo-dGTP pyrophosphatase MutT (NUDIX family)
VALSSEVIALAGEYDEGRRVAVEPRDAATVVLTRAGAAGPEVYLLSRQTSMAFAAGMAVFPGGGVDPRDAHEGVPWAGPSPAAWAAQLGCAEVEARALVCAAVRETFEESGVLLAGPSATEVVGDVSGDDWEADRVALSRRGLVLRSDLLGAWAGWTTPTFEPRRYRTWFFVAALPPGQVTRDVSSESAAVQWMPAGRAVELAEEGTLALMPPTYLTCLDIARFADPDALLAEAATRRIEMFTPSVEGDRLSLLPLHRDLLSARGRL